MKFNTFLPNLATLQGLRTVLNFQLSSIVLLLLVYILFPLFVLLIVAAAILFIPYMLLALFNEKKYGWIIFFCVMVLIPLFSTLIFVNNQNIIYGLLAVSLGLFYLYCFILRFTVNDWIRERNWKKHREHQKLVDEMYKDVS